MSHCLKNDCKMEDPVKVCYCECGLCLSEPAMCGAVYQVADLSIRAEPRNGGWCVALRHDRSTLYFVADDERDAKARAAILAGMVREGVLQ